MPARSCNSAVHQRDGHSLGGGAALHEPGIGRLDGRDGPSDYSLSQAAVGLDLQDLRHGAFVGCRSAGSGLEAPTEVVQQVVDVLQTARNPDRPLADSRPR